MPHAVVITGVFALGVEVVEAAMKLLALDT